MHVSTTDRLNQQRLGDEFRLAGSGAAENHRRTPQINLVQQQRLSATLNHPEEQMIAFADDFSIHANRMGRIADGLDHPFPAPKLAREARPTGDDSAMLLPQIGCDERTREEAQQGALTDEPPGAHAEVILVDDEDADEQQHRARGHHRRGLRWGRRPHQALGDYGSRQRRQPPEIDRFVVNNMPECHSISFSSRTSRLAMLGTTSIR